MVCIPETCEVGLYQYVVETHAHFKIESRFMLSDVVLYSWKLIYSGINVDTIKSDVDLLSWTLCDNFDFCGEYGTPQTRA